MEMTETIVGLVALTVITVAGIFTCVLVAARRRKAKKQLQTLLGTVYPSANRKTK